MAGEESGSVGAASLRGKDRSVRVRPAEETDLPTIAEIGAEAFRGLRPVDRARVWVEACFRSAPRMRYWVADGATGPLGYILWMEKGGFRDEAVLELEQVAVRATARNLGVGSELVRRSLAELEADLGARGARLKLVEVTTGTDQGAVDFYRRTLGAEPAAVLPNLFHGDELVLIARR